jgi:hypothetical protein
MERRRAAGGPSWGQQTEWEDFQVLASRRWQHETRTVLHAGAEGYPKFQDATHVMSLSSVFWAAGGECKHPGDVQPLSQPGSGVLPAAMTMGGSTLVWKTLSSRTLDRLEDVE